MFKPAFLCCTPASGTNNVGLGYSGFMLPLMLFSSVDSISISGVKYKNMEMKKKNRFLGHQSTGLAGFPQPEKKKKTLRASPSLSCFGL